MANPSKDARKAIQRAQPKFIFYDDIEVFSLEMSLTTCPVRLSFSKLRRLSRLPREDILCQLKQSLDRKKRVVDIEFRSTYPGNHDLQDMAMAIAGVRLPCLKSLSIRGKGVREAGEIVNAFGKTQQQQQQQEQGNSSCNRSSSSAVTSISIQTIDEVEPDPSELLSLVRGLAKFEALQSINLKLDGFSSCQELSVAVLEGGLLSALRNLKSLSLHLDFGWMENDEALSMLARLLYGIGSSRQQATTTSSSAPILLDLELSNCPGMFSSYSSENSSAAAATGAGAGGGGSRNVLLKRQLEFLAALQMYPPKTLKLHNVGIDSQASARLFHAATRMVDTKLTLCGNTGFLSGSACSQLIRYLPEMKLHSLRIYDFDGCDHQRLCDQKFVLALRQNIVLRDLHFYSGANYTHYFCSSRHYGQEAEEILTRNRHLGWTMQVTKIFGKDGDPTLSLSKYHSAANECPSSSRCFPLALWSRALAKIGGTKYGADPAYIALQSLAMAGWNNGFDNITSQSP